MSATQVWVHTPPLMIQDEIRRAFIARLAKQASRAEAKSTGALRGRWIALRRMIPSHSGRAYGQV